MRGWSATRLGDERERLARREDADGAKRIEGAQVLIAGDDEAGVGGKRTGEHLVIVGVATDWGDLGGAHELCEGAITGDQVRRVAADLEDARSELLAGENVLQLGDERGAGEEGQALRAGGGEHLSRHAAPQECRDDGVGVVETRVDACRRDIEVDSGCGS